MKSPAGWCVMVALTAGSTPAMEEAVLENLYINAGVGLERPVGEDSTGYAAFGVNWAVPLTSTNGLALGLQLGGGPKFREDDPEWNATVGGFARNFATFGGQRGAAAVLFDYRRTAFQDDLWAIRPIIGTTVSERDALGLEGMAGLNVQRRERGPTSLRTFWTRGWSEWLNTEIGAGYELRHVRGALFRARAAIRLTDSTDLWCGADANLNGNYAVGVGVSYRLGGAGRPNNLNHIAGSGGELYTPFPTADFPSLLSRKK